MAYDLIWAIGFGSGGYRQREARGGDETSPEQSSAAALGRSWRNGRYKALIGPGLGRGAAPWHA